MHLTLQDIEEGPSRHHVIFRCVAGSRMYGTVHAASDTDIRGIFMLPASAYLTIEETQGQVMDKKHDRVYYGIRRFIELAMRANPNIIELLFAPEDCVQWESPTFGTLAEHRHLFLSKRCFQSHMGYARAQIKRARGRHKWVNNPQPEAAPRQEEFCWFLPRDTAEKTPFRPILLRKAEIDLSQCHCALLERSPDLFRLYHYGAEAKGVFRDGSPVCESIPLEDEQTRCIGLLIYQRSAYERALRDHTNYWHWRRERNDARWQSQERGEMDYDAKNMMHTFRLLLSGMHLLDQGEPLVRFEGEALAFLMRILSGDYVYRELIEKAEEHLKRFEASRALSPLPENVDRKAIGALFEALTHQWEREHPA